MQECCGDSTVDHSPADIIDSSAAVAHVMTKTAFAKRTRQAILEINHEELKTLAKKEKYLAVLFQDDSKKSVKALHDLELIKADSHLFGVSWRRIHVLPAANNDTSESGCHVVLYKAGNATDYPGKPDRQTAVFRWIIKEIFCHIDVPLDIDQQKFQVLLRSFRNFILVVTSSMIKSARQLVHQFSRQADLCGKVGRTLVTATDDPKVIQSLELSKRPPLLLHIVHGLYIVFEGNLQDMTSVLEWINIQAPTNLKVVGETNLELILEREDVVIVLFIDESTPLLNAALKKATHDLELTFGLAIVDVTDVQVAAAAHNITAFPTVALFENGVANKYQNDLKAQAAATNNVTKVAARVKAWVMDRLEASDRIVVKTITSEAFKSHPDDFKHVLLKEHKDSMRKLSMEYARLQQENHELRAIIDAAQEALSVVVDPDEQPKKTTDSEGGEEEGKSKKKTGVSVECRDCLASVGMAVWNCGTFEMDCIKNAIELGSECYPCVCEILDFWWPDDAPNCFKKEIQKITGTKTTNEKDVATEAEADKGKQQAAKEEKPASEEL